MDNKFFIVVNKNGGLYSNVLATMHDINRIYERIDNKKEWLFPVREFDERPVITVGSIAYSLSSLRIIEGEDADEIERIQLQIDNLREDMAEVVKNAKRRKAKREDFHEQEEW